MNTLIVIPVRGTAPSKTRLATLFGSANRLLLVRRLLDHVLAQLPRHADVAVITRNPVFVADLPPAVQVIAQDSDYLGLNGSLLQALRIAADAGYADMLMLPADLPLLQPHEVTALLHEEGRMVIVGDRDQEGTNGLRLPTAWAGTFAFGMGEHSFAHHVAEGRRYGVVPITVYHRGLAHDLDTTDDWLALPEATRTHLIERLHPAAKGA